MAASPTSRTLALMREQGWESWVVERWTLSPAGKKKPGERQLFHLQNRLDLWNFGDVIAFKVGEGILVVQTTSYSGVSSRLKKILAEDRALGFLRSGGKIHIHGWRKLAKPVDRKWWHPRIVVVTEEMFDDYRPS